MPGGTSDVYENNAYIQLTSPPSVPHPPHAVVDGNGVGVGVLVGNGLPPGVIVTNGGVGVYVGAPAAISVGSGVTVGGPGVTVFVGIPGVTFSQTSLSAYTSNSSIISPVVIFVYPRALQGFPSTWNVINVAPYLLAVFGGVRSRARSCPEKSDFVHVFLQS